MIKLYLNMFTCICYGALQNHSGQKSRAIWFNVNTYTIAKILLEISFDCCLAYKRFSYKNMCGLLKSYDFSPDSDGGERAEAVTSYGVRP